MAKGYSDYWRRTIVTIYPHASTHEVGGADLIDARGLQGAFITAPTFAGLPAAGLIGRYAATTDTKQIFWDNGVGWVEISSKAVFGAWVIKAVNTVYQAATPGVVCALNFINAKTIQGLTDAADPPVTPRGYAYCWGMGQSISFPVRATHYYEVTSNGPVTYFWIPSL